MRRGILLTELKDAVESMNPHFRGERFAAQYISEAYGVECSPRYIKTETEAGRLTVVIFANKRHYAKADLDAWFASKRKVAAGGDAA